MFISFILASITLNICPSLSMSFNLNGEGTHSLIFSVGSSNANIEMRNNGTMKIESNMGKVEVVDGTEQGDYSKVITTNVDNTLSLRYQTFKNNSKEWEGYDSKVFVEVKSIEMTFLNKFIDNLVNYFSEMDEMKLYLSNSAKEIAKSSIERKKSTMKVDVEVKNPKIIIPKHSSSKEVMIVDLGEISIKLNDIEREGQIFNVIEAKIKEMNIAISHLLEMKNKSYLIEHTTIKVVVERLIDVSVHKMPSMYINGDMSELKLNVSDFTVGMIVGILEGNLCEKGKKNENQSIQRHKKLAESKKIEIKKEEEKKIQKIDPPKESEGEVWIAMLIDFSFGQFSLSLAKGGSLEQSAQDIALLEINEMAFSMTNRNNQTMDIDVGLKEILFFDKKTKNTKFPMLFSPLLKDKESKLIDVKLRKDEKGNQNISIILEDMRMQLVPEPIWELNVWMLPLLNKFLGGLDTWGKNQSKQPNQEQQIEIQPKSEEKRPTEENLDNKLSLEVKIKRPEIVLIENVLDEKSKAILLDSQITFTFESSKKMGMVIGLNMNKLSLSKLIDGDKISSTVMNEPWEILARIEDSNGFKKIEIDLKRIYGSIPIQICQLLIHLQEKWLSVISGSNQEKSPENKGEIANEEKIESKNQAIIENEKQKTENAIEKKTESTKENIMTIITRTGNINLTLIDDINNQNDPILLLVLQSGVAELTMNGISYFIKNQNLLINELIIL